MNVHLNTLIASIKTNAQKNIFTPQLPPLCMLTENGFSHQKIDNWNFLVDVGSTIEIQSP
jgi:hypothetical protein